MRVLITGGAGYIGSVMTEYFVAKGFEVWVLDNLSRGYRDAVAEDAIFVEGDINNALEIFDSKERFDGIIHLAAHSRVEESVQNPSLYWENNAVGTHSILEFARIREIPRFVFASTAAVYGLSAQSPIVEDTPPSPANTYGMTKLTMDMAIDSYSRAYGLTGTSLRFFNVSGTYRGRRERHLPETHLIPVAISKIKEGDKVTIFGSDYPTRDGTCIRDYIHVVDLARAAELALGRSNEGSYKVYNLGNGNGYSNLEVVRTISEVLGVSCEIEFSKRRDGDAPELVTSSRLITEELGWTPSIPALADIVKSSLD